ncbi:MAG TPA: ABC transporter substrate-binding protein, partial [Anaerolineales bacterium]
MGQNGGEYWSRRQFLGRAVAVGAAGILGGAALGRVAQDFLGDPWSVLAADPPPEVSAIRLCRLGRASPGSPLCFAPMYYAEEFLRDEGFTAVQYLDVSGADVEKALASGQIDMTMNDPGRHIIGVDTGAPIVMLGGVHVGCYELFGTNRVRNIRDLKGKTVAGGVMGGSRQVFLTSMLAYVGIDFRKDVNWVAPSPAQAMQLLADEKIDAFLAFPPEPQELRARKIGHLVVSTMMDRPWSQYFCCLVGANREFMKRHPVATKRVLRAMMKAADACAREPQRVARFLVAKGYADRYDYALQAMKDIPYNRWREYSSEDTVRFHALRLRDAGLIRHTPADIIAWGTNWRFLNDI